MGLENLALCLHLLCPLHTSKTMRTNANIHTFEKCICCLTWLFLGLQTYKAV